MRQSAVTHLLCSVSFAILLTACTTTQIAEDVADKAPPATPPEITALAKQIYRWNGNTEFFITSDPFELDIKRSLPNKLRILMDGNEVPRFDGNDPTNAQRTTFISKDTSADTTNQILQSHLTIVPPIGGYAKDMVVTFALEEESINPRFRGTPQERASQIFRVVVPRPPQGITAYMERCFGRGVPLPPDWAQTGTAWIYHGNLGASGGLNLLQPGQDAHVWSYSDPRFKGACVALPRGSGGGRGGLAGVICQSSESGAACFWDSRKRDDNDPLREMPAINWQTDQPLRIKQLKDATNLTEAGSGVCPECHRGNNVFLVSPDATPWASVLRTNPNLGGTFKTTLDASADMRGNHPRYIPITSTQGPGRPGWSNDLGLTGTQCSACHEDQSSAWGQFPNFSVLRNQMPPVCGANCYR